MGKANQPRFGGGIVRTDEPPTWAAVEEMLMIRPQWAARIAGSTAWDTKNADFRFTSISSSQSASVTSSSLGCARSRRY